LDEPVVRVARAPEAEALADIIAEALYDDPPNVWAFPDPARRREILPRFFRLFVDDSIDSGGAFTLDDLAAVSLWFPPGSDMSDDQVAAFDDAVRAIAGDYAESGPLAIVKAMSEVQPTDLHWHLAFVCTRPERQGRGFGTALIRDGLERCDAAGHPAYLEATSERNRALYERLGFHVTSRIDLPDGPPMWGMWREPLT
jgi:ribosomal protein S18 acetylase RimI-like enzyme